MEITLDTILQDEEKTVTEILAEPDLSARLRDFGLIPGTKVICRYLSPGRHLLAIECRGAVLALRRRDAGGIRVAE